MQLYGNLEPVSRRNAVGVTPTNSRNTRFSWDASLNPTASATSASERSGLDNSPFARWIRSDRTYWYGGRPTVSLKALMKWYWLNPATAARSDIVISFEI